MKTNFSLVKYRFFIFGVLLFTGMVGCKKTTTNSNTGVFVPDSAVFAKERPSPGIVRGFMMNDVFGDTDCVAVQSWGANVIRIQMLPAKFASNLGKPFLDAWPSFLDQLEQQVLSAEQQGLKVVVDLHEPPFDSLAGFDDNSFWNRSDLEPALIKAWHDIAERLLPHRNSIWGYDLLNEPLNRSQLPGVATQWRPLAIKILQTIRKLDPDTWIVFEPGPGSLFSGFKNLEPLPDKHIIYSAHFYDPQTFTHQGVGVPAGTDLAIAMEQINVPYPSSANGVVVDKAYLESLLKDADNFQARWKVPIYVGEFSVIKWAPKESAKQWLTDITDLFDQRGWSWTYHAFREFLGWDLEYDESFWMEGFPIPPPVNYETDRAKIIKNAFKQN